MRRVVWVLALCGLLGAAGCTFTLSFPNGTVCSDFYTLTPAVTYTMNLTFPTSSITAGSTVTIQFGYRYNLTTGVLSGCQFATGTGSYQAGSCSVAKFGTGTSTTYIVTYSNVYPSLASSQSSLNLKVPLALASSRSPTPGAEARGPPRTSWSSSTTPAATPWALDSRPSSSGPPS
jgi:hypothetical protein